MLKPTIPANPQKARKGLSRVWHVFGYSLAGLRAGWGETAFRQEAIASVILLPAAFWLGRNWVEVVLLAGTVILTMIVEFSTRALKLRLTASGPNGTTCPNAPKTWAARLCC